MRVKTGRYPATIKVPFTGKGTAIADGALVMPGVTQATDMGLAIPVPTANAGLDQFAILKGASVVANDSVQAGTTWTYAEVELITSADLMEVDYSQVTADLLTATQAVSTTTMTLTSLQNNMDCSWFYVAAGTGVGQLLFATAVNGGTATLMTAPSPALDTTSKMIMILRFGAKIALVSAVTGTPTKFSSAAAAGTYTFLHLELYIDSPANGINKQLLNPTIHNGLTLKQNKVNFSVVGLPRLAGGYS